VSILRPTWLLTLSALALLSAGRLPAAGPAYGLVDLGTLGGTYSEALGINASGQVVGGSEVANGNLHAFLYSGGKMTDLGVFAGGSQSEATAINTSGQIAGWSSVSSTDDNGFPITFGFLYSGGKMTSIGTLTGDPDSLAFGINDSGNIVGVSYTLDSNDDYIDENAVLYSNAEGLSDLGPLLSGIEVDLAEANGINDGGQVAGWSATGQVDAGNNSEFHAVRYAAGGGVADLGVLPKQTDSIGLGINAAGNVVGYCSTATGPTLAFEDSNFGGMVSLGHLTHGTNSFSTAINTSGQVVGAGDIGVADGNGDLIYDAFLYTGGTMYDLNTLTLNVKGWRIIYAAGINDSGQIVGRALNAKGQTHAVLLQPIGLAPPIVTTAPVSQIVKAGATVTFTVATLSATLVSFQWQKGSVNLSGNTATKLTLKKVTAASAGTYAVVMHNANGNSTISATLQVVTNAPKIMTQPVSSNVTTDGTASFTVKLSAGDPPLTYTWQKSGIALKNANNYSGVSTPTLTITKVNAGNAGSFRVVISNLAAKATSVTVKLVVAKAVVTKPTATTK
jgi:probable HAF family extracellular repeat protein